MCVWVEIAYMRGVPCKTTLWYPRSMECNPSRQPSTYQGFHSRYIDKKTLPFYEIFKIASLVFDVIFSGNASVFYKAGAVSIPKRE